MDFFQKNFKPVRKCRFGNRVIHKIIISLAPILLAANLHTSVKSLRLQHAIVWLHSLSKSRKGLVQFRFIEWDTDRNVDVNRHVVLNRQIESKVD